MNGRTGTYKTGEVPADRNWHTIVDNLKSSHGFEVMARVGDKGKGRHSLMHAIALSTYGKSRGKIRKTRAYYGWWWNRLSLRWSGDTYNYKLQLRSCRNYGEGINIRYNLMKLWDDDFMIPKQDIHI